MKNYVEEKSEKDDRMQLQYTYKIPPDAQKGKRVIKRDQERRMLRCNHVKVHYYYDIPGMVTQEQLAEFTPPQCGVKIQFGQFRNNEIYYGPWADHQRSLLMSFFYPYTYEDVPVVKQEVGKLRKPLRFDIRLQFENETAWLFPFRRYPQTPEEKKAGVGNEEVLSIAFDRGSSILWSYSYGPTQEGGSYSTEVAINLVAPICSTSCTNAVFVEAASGEVFYLRLYGMLTSVLDSVAFT